MINELYKILNRHKKFYDNITVYVTGSSSKSIQLNGHETESISCGEDTGIAVRACKDGRIASFGYDGDDTDKLNNFLEDYKSVISEILSDSLRYIPEIADLPQDTDNYDETFENLTTADLKTAADRITDSALKSDSRMKYVKQSIAAAEKNSLTIIQPDREPLVSVRTEFSAMAYAIAQDGGEQDAYGTHEAVYFNDLLPELAGERAAESACALLRAKRLKTGKYGILFSADVMAEFAGLLSELMNGDNLYKNISMFSGRLGQKAASSLLTITDEPYMQKGTGSRTFDAEGQKTSFVNLMEKGIFSNALTDSYAAKALGIKNTANAVLLSGGGIAPGYSNLKINPTTDKKPYDFMPDYVKVTEVMGMHTADTISGDFSVGVSGVIYKGEEAVHPFREAVLAGNLKDLLNGVIAVFSNMRTSGGITTGDALFDKMTVSGE